MDEVRRIVEEVAGLAGEVGGAFYTKDVWPLSGAFLESTGAPGGAWQRRVALAAAKLCVRRSVRSFGHGAPVRCPGAAVALGMPFKAVSSAAPAPEGPLELFDELPRMPGSVPELWRQQGEILTDYKLKFENEPDVAVELPTGTGKTVVGLLIGDWRRRKYQRPVLYACPTQQLANQVAVVAKREGMPGVTLLGSHTKWSPVDESKYEGADALGITTYSAIFNTAPKVGYPGTIVFDDAACRGAVRRRQRGAFRSIAPSTMKPTSRCSRHSVRGSVACSTKAWSSPRRTSGHDSTCVWWPRSGGPRWQRRSTRHSPYCRRPRVPGGPGT